MIFTYRMINMNAPANRVNAAIRMRRDPRIVTANTFEAVNVFEFGLNAEAILRGFTRLADSPPQVVPGGGQVI